MKTISLDTLYLKDESVFNFVTLVFPLQRMVNELLKNFFLAAKHKLHF